MQFVPSRYAEATKKVYQAYKTLRRIEETVVSDRPDIHLLQDKIKTFESFMDNDFNTVSVLADINDTINIINEELNKKVTKQGLISAYKEYLMVVGKILGIFDLSPSKVLSEIEDLFLYNSNLSRSEIEKIIQLRIGLRNEKKYEQADKLRTELLEKGVTLLDSSKGTTWELAV